MRFLEIIKNKKSIFIIKIIAIFLLLTYIIFFAFNKSSNIEYSGKKLVNEKKYQKEKEIFEKKDEVDTDGDGLLDWEEVLYNTNINNKDSDEDGVSDYDEISLGQDPLISGKGDSVRISENIVKKDGIIQVKKEIINKKKNNDNYLEEKEKLEFLKNNDKEKYDKIKERNNIYKKDINKIASVEIALKKLGSSKILLDSFDKAISGDINNNDKIILLEASKILEIQYRAYGYIKVSNINLNKYLNGLKIAYKNTSSGLKKIAEYDYVSNSIDDDEYQNIMDKYRKGVKNINKNLIKINEFVVKNNIEFSNGESGKFFEFSL